MVFAFSEFVFKNNHFIIFLTFQKWFQHFSNFSKKITFLSSKKYNISNVHLVFQIPYYQSFPRKIQLDLLKRQFKLRKKLQKWRDIQLDHFGFERSQGLGNNSYTACFQMLVAHLIFDTVKNILTEPKIHCVCGYFI